MEVSQLRHLKHVESELSRLKPMYVDLALEHHALKGVRSQNV
jgi:putative transposase